MTDYSVKHNNKQATTDSIKRPSLEEAEAAVRTLILWAGDNPEREGLKNTPTRVAKAYKEIFAGYDEDCSDNLSTFFSDIAGYCDPVMVKDIPFYSHCEHHMVPIIGKAHLSYIPNDRVIGLSKLARIVNIYAKRLQTQESMTAQIASYLQQLVQPKGLAVLIEAEHLCMSMRGIKNHGTSTITSSYSGEYKTNKELKEQFLKLIHIK